MTMELVDGKWKLEPFKVAMPNGTMPERLGMTYRGLGIYQKPGEDTWVVIHLNTGMVAKLLANMGGRAIPILSDLAECIDWDYAGAMGWQNSEPQLIEKMEAWSARHGMATWDVDKPKVDQDHADKMAREIYRSRI